MAKDKPTHFGERLRKMLVQKFGSQKEGMEYLYKEGALNTLHQSAISRYIRMRQLPDKLIDKFEPALRKKDLNPEFLRDSRVKDWRLRKGEADLTEMDIIRLQKELIDCHKEKERLQDRINELESNL